MAIFFGLTLGMGISGMGLGAPIASLGALIIGMTFYLSGKWKNKKIVDVEATA